MNECHRLRALWRETQAELEELQETCDDQSQTLHEFPKMVNMITKDTVAYLEKCEDMKLEMSRIKYKQKEDQLAHEEEMKVTQNKISQLESKIEDLSNQLTIVNQQYSSWSHRLHTAEKRIAKESDEGWKIFAQSRLETIERVLVIPTADKLIKSPKKSHNEESLVCENGKPSMEDSTTSAVSSSEPFSIDSLPKKRKRKPRIHKD